MAELKIPVTSKDHIQGEENAPAILVEYGDYECPHCGHAYPIVKKVQKHFGKKLAFVFRNFPLNEIHPHAEAAAEAAEFAGSQGKYWEMHDGIFENQTSLSLPMLMELAESVGLPQKGLQDSLTSREFAQHVKSDFIGGARSGVNGTPTFFLNGERFYAPADYEDLVAAIDIVLSAKE
jgi:protein-disulfide isomerase